MRSRLTVLVGALVFFDLVLWFAVAPLLPGWEHSLHLSKAQSGIVVGAYSAAVLLASVPAGSLADRFGPRRVTIAATLLFAVAAPLHAFVGSLRRARRPALRGRRLQRRLLVGRAGLGARQRRRPRGAGAPRRMINAGLPIGRDRGPALRRPARALRRAEGRDGRPRRRRAGARRRSPRASPRSARPSTSTSRCATASAPSRATPGCSAPNVALIVLAIVGHHDADARLAAPRRHGASRRAASAPPSPWSRSRAPPRRSRSPASPTGVDRLKTRGLRHAPARARRSARWRCRSARPRSSAAMVACGHRAVDRLRGRVSARGRRRRAGRRRAGRRDGPAQRQLGRRRADRPRADRHGGRAGERRDRVRARGRARAGRRARRPLAHPRVSSIVAACPRPTPAHAATEAIVLESVTKRFDDVVAVDDVSFEIHEGEFFSMLGPSGCGKTTTLRMIAGFEEPSDGPHPAARRRRHARAAGQAARQHGVPVVRALPAHERVRERRVRAAREARRP